MLDRADKKAIILCVLKILEQYTDSEHLLTYEEIAQRIEDDFGVAKPSRNTIAKHIAILKNDAFGYDIERGDGGNGVYLHDRILGDIQINVLVKHLETAKYMTDQHAQEFIKALEALKNKHTRGLKNISSVKNYIHQRNKQFFWNLEIIGEAIDRNKQIGFNYNNVGLNGELLPRKKAGDLLAYRVHPFAMACVDGFYYLIGSAFSYNELRHYRIDHITNIKLLEDQKRNALRSMKGYENTDYFDLADYVRKHVMMFNGEVIRIKFQGELALINYIWDVFGDRAEIRELQDEPGKIEFVVHTTAGAAKIFAKQYCNLCQLVAPANLRQELKEEFTRVLKNY